MKIKVDYFRGEMAFSAEDCYSSKNILLTLDDSIMVSKIIEFSFKSKTLRLLYVKTKYDLFFYDDKSMYNEIQILLKDNPQDVYNLLKKYYQSSEIMSKLLKSLYNNMLKECSLISETYLQHFSDRYTLILEYDGAVNNSIICPVCVDSLCDANMLFMNFNREYMETAKTQAALKMNDIRAKRQQEKAKLHPQLDDEAYEILPDIIRMEPFVSHRGIIAFRRITIASTGELFIRLYSSYNFREAIYVYDTKEIDKKWMEQSAAYEVNPVRVNTFVFIPDDIDLFAKALSFIMPELHPFVVNTSGNQRNDYIVSMIEDDMVSQDYPSGVSVDKGRLAEIDDCAFDIYRAVREEWEYSGIRQLVNLKRTDYDRVMQKYNITRDVCNERVKSRNKDAALQNERETKLSGIRGEKEVEYVLNWLGGNSIFIDDNTTDKFGNPCIKLKNKQFRDEAQEYDHIAIRENGVFVIETKNYGGKIVISTDGNWNHTNSKGETKGLRNPSQQVYRHEVLLKSILPKDIPIISLICLSNPNLIIEGQSNSKVPVFKSDLIAEYIVGHKSKVKITPPKMHEIKELIENYYSD